MSFLVDINPEMELPKYRLTLHKLNEEPLGSLKNITGLKISPLFVGIHNLSFNVPLYIMNSDGTNSRNKIYDLVEGDHLVKLNDMKFFIITNVTENADDNGNKYKEVQCKSREYGLIGKKLTDYKADSRVLYDPSDTMLDGLEKGILNYIFKYLTKSWTLDYVDPDLILREGKGIYRALNFSDSNLIQVFMELQKTFNCIFTFDSLSRKVSVYDIKNMMGQNKGLYISDTNFIKRITKDINSDGIVTRLILRGKDGVSIQSISPTGQPYLDNFEYYKKPKYMTQGLIDALNSYQSKVNGYNPDFEPLFILLNEANTVMEGLLNADGIELADKGLVALKTKLSQVQTLIDVKVEELGLLQNTINNAEGTDLSSLYASKVSIQSAIDTLVAERTTINGFITTKESQIATQQSVINGIEGQIKSLQYNLDMSNPTNFTEAQLKELDEFIKVETFSDSNYTEHNLQELKEEGIRQLNRLSQPPIQFSVDSVDFLSIVQCQHIWKKFVLGDVVTIEHKEMGFKFVVRLVGYDHDVDSHSLNLKFSSTDSYDDATLYERDLMEYINDIGTTVDFNTDRWNDVGNIESRIAKMVDAKLEESRQNILNAVGQKYLFGDDGLWLYKENPDGTINPEQIRAINNTIALTKNNWNTVGTAITPDGIIANQVFGKMGKYAVVNANQIEVSNAMEYDYLTQPTPPYTVGETWMNNDVIKVCINERITGLFNADDWKTTIASHIDNVVDEINNTIAISFSDSSITNIEANSIALLRDSLVKEADNAILIADNIGLYNRVITDIIRDSYKDVFRPDATTLNILNNVMTINYSKYGGFNAVGLSKSEYIGNEDYGYYVGSGNIISVEFDIMSNNIWNNEIHISFQVDDGDGNYTIEEKIPHGQTGHIKFNAVANSDYIRFLLMPDDDGRLINPSDPIWDSAGVFKIANLQISFPQLSEIENAIDNVNTEAGKYINKTNYPIPVSELDRINLTSVFENLEIALANLYEKINEKRDSNSIKQNIVYNGVVINTANGLQVTASNNLARSTFNASEGILVESRPNTSSAWQRNFYVDTSGKLQAKNIEIDGSGKFTGEIQATSGTFKGRVEANDGFFKGDITGASGTFAGVVNASDYRIGGASILENNKIHGNFLTNVIANSVSANWVYAGNISANQISTGSLSADRISGGTISGVTINVSENATVGNKLLLGTQSLGTTKGLYFTDNSYIASTSNALSMYSSYGMDIYADFGDLKVGTRSNSGKSTIISSGGDLRISTVSSSIYSKIILEASSNTTGSTIQFRSGSNIIMGITRDGVDFLNKPPLNLIVPSVQDKANTSRGIEFRISSLKLQYKPTNSSTWVDII